MGELFGDEQQIDSVAKGTTGTEIKQTDLSAAINQLKNNKSPGKYQVVRELLKLLEEDKKANNNTIK